MSNSNRTLLSNCGVHEEYDKNQEQHPVQCALEHWPLPRGADAWFEGSHRLRDYGQHNRLIRMFGQDVNQALTLASMPSERLQSTPRKGQLASGRNRRRPLRMFSLHLSCSRIFVVATRTVTAEVESLVPGIGWRAAS